MKTKHLFFAMLILAFVLTACGQQQPPATVDQNAINQQIETSVAQTVVAGEALTAAAQPAVSETPAAPATNTSFPTLTPFATITPFVITPSSGGGGGSGGSSGGGTVWYGGEQCGDDPKYMGAIMDQKPHDGSPETIRKAGEIERLDVTWTIKNVGTKTWQPDWAWTFDNEEVNSDIPANKLLSLYPLTFTPVGSGYGPQAIGDVIEPGEFITLGVELTMPPSIEGRNPVYFTIQMALVGDAGYKFCRPWIQIEVIRPGMTP